MPDSQTSDDILDPINSDILDITRHLCWIYKDEEQMLEIVIPSIFSWLSENIQCLVAVTAESWRHITDRLEKEGFDIGPHLERGQVIVAEPADFFLNKGILDIESVVERLRYTAHRAADSGWSSLALIGNIADVVKSAPENKWREYELRIEYETSRDLCVVLCLYDSNMISGDFISMLLKTHRVIGINSQLSLNPFFVSVDAAPV